MAYIPGIAAAADGSILTEDGIVVGAAIQTPALNTGVSPLSLTGPFVDPSTFDILFTVDDTSSGDSYWAGNNVRFLTWTPEISGTLLLAPPPISTDFPELVYLLFAGTDVGADVPSLDGTGTHGDPLAAAYWAQGPPTSIQPATADVTAGQPYTVALRSQGSAVYSTASFANWVLSTQGLGGQAQQIRPGGASAALSVAEGLVTKASGVTAHAEGLSTAAPGQSAHAEGIGTTASGTGAHAEGLNTSAAGDSSHAEGDTTNTAGQSAHTEGIATAAIGDASHAEGSGSNADHFAEHASASGSFATPGDAQYSRLVVYSETTDATPATLGLTFITPISVPSGQTWAISAEVVASRQDTPGTVAAFFLRGLVTRASGSLRLVGTVDQLAKADAAASTWDATLTVASTHVDITVTGEAANTIFWVGTVHATRVGI